METQTWHLPTPAGWMVGRLNKRLTIPAHTLVPGRAAPVPLALKETIQFHPIRPGIFWDAVPLLDLRTLDQWVCAWPLKEDIWDSGSPLPHSQWVPADFSSSSFGDSTSQHWSPGMGARCGARTTHYSRGHLQNWDIPLSSHLPHVGMKTAHSTSPSILPISVWFVLHILSYCNYV